VTEEIERTVVEVIDLGRQDLFLRLADALHGVAIENGAHEMAEAVADVIRAYHVGNGDDDDHFVMLYHAFNSRVPNGSQLPWYGELYGLWRQAAAERWR
jgi:hypothetical protein